MLIVDHLLDPLAVTPDELGQVAVAIRQELVDLAPQNARQHRRGAVIGNRNGDRAAVDYRRKDEIAAAAIVGAVFAAIIVMIEMNEKSFRVGQKLIFSI